MSDIELEPCPFCGGEATIQENELLVKGLPKNGAKTFEVGCNNIGCTTLPSAEWATNKD